MMKFNPITSSNFLDVKRLLSLMIFAAFVASCTKDTTSSHSLLDQVELDASGDDLAHIVVSSDAQLTIDSDQNEWFDVTFYNSTNRAAIIVAKENQSSSSREGTFKLTSSKHEITVTVKQDGASDMFDLCYNEISFGKLASEFELPVHSNLNWSVSCSSDWLDLSTNEGSGNGNVVLTTSDCPNVDSRKAELVFVYGSKTVVLPIVQYGSGYQIEELRSDEIAENSALVITNNTITNSQIRDLSAIINDKRGVELRFINITDIPSSAFHDCTNIEIVSAPKVTSVGAYAFKGLAYLRKIDLPSVQAIGNNAFESCVNLSQANIVSVKSIGFRAFALSGIESLDVPNAVELGQNALQDCLSLSSVNMPKITVINQYAFAGSRIANIVLDNVKELHSNAFVNCSYLKNITIPKLNVLNSNAFEGLVSLEKLTIATESDAIFFFEKPYINPNIMLKVELLTSVGSASLKGEWLINGSVVSQFKDIVIE